MKLAVVVQRYSADVSGGAELHARYIAELLAKRHTVHVLTTCARDYITWRNEHPAGTETIEGIEVHRFPVRRQRDPIDFGKRSLHIFGHEHSFADELAWLESEGPTSPALIRHIAENREHYDFFLFFSFRYYHTYHGVRATPGRAVLVPTAERDPVVGLSLFGPIFRSVRALMYNSPEERAMIQATSQNTAVPGVVVGIGSRIPERTRPERFRRKFDVRDPFIVYVGRVDENKGCAEMFSFFLRYAAVTRNPPTLVLMGNSVLPIPESPFVRHLGFVSDEDKFDAIAGAQALIMPSFFESLSMVALEAWALEKPVLANGRCDVLKGQAIRSDGGLYYENADEFFETMRLLTTNSNLNAALGRNGRRYFARHYTWPVIAQKYEDVLARLAEQPSTGAMEPEPGWLAARRRTIPPASDVLERLPSGPVVEKTRPAVPRGRPRRAGARR